MIYCPQCNTANRDNSKFCNECGADLRAANVRCQMCGDMNPPDRVNCAHCGARLKLLVNAEPEELPAEDAPTLPTSSPIAPVSAAVPAPMAPPQPASDSQPQERQAESIASPTADELPDWLHGLRPSPPGESASSTESPARASTESLTSEDSAAWMSDARSSPATEPQATEPIADEELPAWLREVRTGSPDDERTPSKAFRTPLMPSRFTPAPQPPTAAETPPAEQPIIEQPLTPAELPDWLTQLRQPGASAENAAVEASETVEMPKADVPDWLADLRETAPIVGERPESAMPLAELGESTNLAEIPTADLPQAEAPDWLKGLAAAQATSQPADWSMNDVAVEDLPDWLKPSAARAGATATQSQPAAVPHAAAPPMGMPTAEGLAPGEIPPWLQALRPGGLETLSGETIETSGLLAGIRGALPVESVLTLPHKSEPGEPTPATVPVSGFAELFAPQPPPPQAFTNREVRSTGVKISWRALLIILIFVVAAVPFLPFFTELRGANITIHPPSSDFYQTVNALRPNQLVLVAIDYSGGSRAELDPQARATLLHLLQNKQHVVTLSFVSDGSQLAQDLLNGLNPANTAFAYPYNYGDTHVNLGYKSDGDAAMRNLVQNPAAVFRTDYRGQPISNLTIATNLKSLNDFALLIVFSDDDAQVRRWINQVARETNKPMLAGVSAAVAPAVMPFYNSRQINGMLAGLRGAAEYETLLSHPASAAATLDSVSYVTIVLVAVIVIGILLALLFRRRSATAA